MPSYEVCPNCGFEFGNDDNPGTEAGVSFEQYRTEWVATVRLTMDAYRHVRPISGRSGRLTG
jgi:rubredoxin